MTQDTRVNFSPDVIEKTLLQQGNCCAKCGLPMNYGFEAHHADGNNANAAEDNCQLLHPRCHESEQYATLVKQRTAYLQHIQGALGQALGPQGMAGAALKEVNTLLDKESAAINQLYGVEHFDMPHDQQLAYQEAATRDRLEAYQAGVMDTIREAIPSMLAGTVAKIDLSKLAKPNAE